MEVMDNEDGTLSLLGTPIDHAGAAALPAAHRRRGRVLGRPVATLSRAFSYNDPRAVRKAAGGKGDRNVELMVRDPFAGKGAGLCAASRPRPPAAA